VDVSITKAVGQSVMTLIETVVRIQAIRDPIQHVTKAQRWHCKDIEDALVFKTGWIYKSSVFLKPLRSNTV
jgi:hypothetical protein